MTLSTLTPAAVEPILHSEDTMRQFLRLEADETEQDTLLAALLAAARAKAESFTRRRFITQTMRLTLDRFCPRIELPVAPIQSVDEVAYQDDAGDWQVVATTVWRFVTSRTPAELHLAEGQSWPIPRLEAAVVRIDLTVGYGDAGTDVPPDILQAIRLAAAHAYYNRESAADGRLPEGARDLLAPHIFWV